MATGTVQQVFPGSALAYTGGHNSLGGNSYGAGSAAPNNGSGPMRVLDPIALDRPRGNMTEEIVARVIRFGLIGIMNASAMEGLRGLAPAIYSLENAIETVWSEYLPNVAPITSQLAPAPSGSIVQRRMRAVQQLHKFGYRYTKQALFKPQGVLDLADLTFAAAMTISNSVCLEIQASYLVAAWAHMVNHRVFGSTPRTINHAGDPVAQTPDSIIDFYWDEIQSHGLLTDMHDWRAAVELARAAGVARNVTYDAIIAGEGQTHRLAAGSQENMIYSIAGPAGQLYLANGVVKDVRRVADMRVVDTLPVTDPAASAATYTRTSYVGEFAPMYHTSNRSGARSRRFHRSVKIFNEPANTWSIIDFGDVIANSPYFDAQGNLHRDLRTLRDKEFGGGGGGGGHGGHGGRMARFMPSPPSHPYFPEMAALFLYDIDDDGVRMRSHYRKSGDPAPVVEVAEHLGDLGVARLGDIDGIRAAANAILTSTDMAPNEIGELCSQLDDLANLIEEIAAIQPGTSITHNIYQIEQTNEADDGASNLSVPLLDGCAVVDDGAIAYEGHCFGRASGPGIRSLAAYSITGAASSKMTETIFRARAGLAALRRFLAIANRAVGKSSLLQANSHPVYFEQFDPVVDPFLNMIGAQIPIFATGSQRAPDSADTAVIHKAPSGISLMLAAVEKFAEPEMQSNLSNMVADIDAAVEAAFKAAGETVGTAGAASALWAQARILDNFDNVLVVYFSAEQYGKTDATAYFARRIERLHLLATRATHYFAQLLQLVPPGNTAQDVWMANQFKLLASAISTPGDVDATVNVARAQKVVDDATALSDQSRERIYRARADDEARHRTMQGITDAAGGRARVYQESRDRDLDARQAAEEAIARERERVEQERVQAERVAAQTALDVQRRRDADARRDASMISAMRNLSKRNTEIAVAMREARDAGRRIAELSQDVRAELATIRQEREVARAAAAAGAGDIIVPQPAATAAPPAPPATAAAAAAALAAAAADALATARTAGGGEPISARIGRSIKSARIGANDQAGNVNVAVRLPLVTTWEVARDMMQHVVATGLIPADPFHMAAMASADSFMYDPAAGRLAAHDAVSHALRLGAGINSSSAGLSGAKRSAEYLEHGRAKQARIGVSFLNSVSSAGANPTTERPENGPMAGVLQGLSKPLAVAYSEVYKQVHKRCEKWMAMLLLFLPITRQNLMDLHRYGTVPLSAMLVRPWIGRVMSSAVVAKAGISTAATFHSGANVIAVMNSVGEVDVQAEYKAVTVVYRPSNCMPLIDIAPLRAIGGAGVQFIKSKDEIACGAGQANYVHSLLCDQGGGHAGDMFGVLLPANFVVPRAFNLLGYMNDLPGWDNNAGLRLADGTQLAQHYPGAPYMIHHYQLTQIANLTSRAQFGSNAGNMMIFAGDCQHHRGSEIPDDFTTCQVSVGHRGKMYEGARETWGGTIQKKTNPMHV